MKLINKNWTSHLVKRSHWFHLEGILLNLTKVQWGWRSLLLFLKPFPSCPLPQCFYLLEPLPNCQVFFSHSPAAHNYQGSDSLTVVRECVCTNNVWWKIVECNSWRTQLMQTSNVPQRNMSQSLSIFLKTIQNCFFLSAGFCEIVAHYCPVMPCVHIRAKNVWEYADKYARTHF